MRDAEHNAAVRALLERIAVGVERIAEACERAERWTAGTAEPASITVGAKVEPGVVSEAFAEKLETLGVNVPLKRKRGKRG